MDDKQLTPEEQAEQARLANLHKEPNQAQVQQEQDRAKHIQAHLEQVKNHAPGS